MTTAIYTTRPRPRKARTAWDYFHDRWPWLCTTERVLRLGYTPNLHGDGPGWILEIAHTDHDLLAWHGSDSLDKMALCSTIANWYQSQL